MGLCFCRFLAFYAYIFLRFFAATKNLSELIWGIENNEMFVILSYVLYIVNVLYSVVLHDLQEIG